MSREKLPRPLLILAKEEGLSVVDDGEILVFSALGAGLTLAKWMYRDAGLIRIDLALSRTNADEREVGGVESLSWDGRNPDKETDGIPDALLDEDAACGVVRRWGALKRLESKLDQEDASVTAQVVEDFLKRMRESSKY
jgi:hypothetical protein